MTMTDGLLGPKEAQHRQGAGDAEVVVDAYTNAVVLTMPRGTPEELTDLALWVTRRLAERRAGTMEERGGRC